MAETPKHHASLALFPRRLAEAIGNGWGDQTRAAKRLRVTRGTVQHWLEGRNFPEIPTLFAIAEAYDVSVDWLLGRTAVRRMAEQISEVAEPPPDEPPMIRVPSRRHQEQSEIIARTASLLLDLQRALLQTMRRNEGLSHAEPWSRMRTQEALTTLEELYRLAIPSDGDEGSES